MPLYSLDGVAPSIDQPDSVWIAPDATIVGNVVIEAEVGVWFGVAIRGDNETIRIGAGTNLQEHVVMHSDPGFPLTVGRACTIGHKAMLHGCTIGDGTLIGMGATVLNGARIGSNCLVGAGSLVTEGKSFEDGWLIMGAPAKPVRQLDARVIEGLKAAAAEYRANARRFKAGLKEVG